MDIFENDIRKVGVTGVFELYSVGDVVAWFGIDGIGPSRAIKRNFFLESSRGFFSYESIGDVTGVFGTAW